MAAVTVIIPALNEAGNIRSLVQELRAVAPVDVLVVDNNSTDATASEARLAGARVVSEPRRGYGYACAAGAAAAEAAGILIFMDGDGSFSPGDLPALLKPLSEGSADFVLGSRELGSIISGSMPFQQRFGNWLVSRLMNTLYGISITDLGPFRAIRKDLLNELDMQEMTYGWPTEMIVKAARRKAHILEIPVSYRSRCSGKSKVSGTVRGTLLATWSILAVTFRHARWA
ncbi:MAG: glycosyltransferase family 2 protein [Anaerolineales bacterium]